MVHLDPAATLERLEAIGLVTSTITATTGTLPVTTDEVDADDVDRALAALRKFGVRVG